MDSQTFENNKKYASERKPSMKRRAVDHDYRERRIYMITMVVEGRRPLLGRLEGDVNAARGTAAAPHVAPTPLGEAVAEAWRSIPRFHPEVSVQAFQLMPDHIHGILFVEKPIEIGLGKVILGFKQGCNKAYRNLFAQSATRSHSQGATPDHSQVATLGHSQGAAPSHAQGATPGHSQGATPGPQTRVEYVAVSQQPSSVAVIQQHTEHSGQGAADRSHGLLFERSYHDRILLREDQLNTMRAYIADNPYRLAMKRARPDLFRVRTDVDICGRRCSAVGNIDLLRAPQILQVRFSRSIDPALLAKEQDKLLTAARNGAVLVSPCISPGEKATMRAAFDAGLQQIVILDNGISPKSKPSGPRFQATAEGRMLLLSPLPHHDDKRPISRNQCNELNALAWDIAHSNT